jgi:hypothetical protein
MLIMHEGVSLPNVENKLDRLHAERPETARSNISFKLQRITDVHLDPPLDRERLVAAHSRQLVGTKPA